MSVGIAYVDGPRLARSAFAAADCYLQPSRYESFSRTIMEAWLAGTPVIANAGSDVVAEGAPLGSAVATVTPVE